MWTTLYVISKPLLTFRCTSSFSTLLVLYTNNVITKVVHIYTYMIILKGTGLTDHVKYTVY